MKQPHDKKDVYTAIGLMSGTSMDGIDVALIKTDGERVIEFGPACEYPFPHETVTHIKAVLGRNDPMAEDIRAVEREVTLLHALAVQKLLGENNLRASEIDLIGFHGQTIFHDPANRQTIQLGDGDLLAEQLGIDVVYDFRTEDVQKGGQGAPLVPVYHRALCHDLQKPAALLNIGGIANITYIGSDDVLIGFDTGPGNGMMNDIVQNRMGLDFDNKGHIARSGRVHDTIVDAYMGHPYFDQKPPKSLDKKSFSLDPVAALSTEDALATLLEFVCVSIERGLALLPEYPETLIVCGGGRKNKALVERLKRASNRSVLDADAVGMRGDFIEAEAFAFMAVRHIKNRPNSFPGTTGVSEPTVGGVFASHHRQKTKESLS